MSQVWGEVIQQLPKERRKFFRLPNKKVLRAEKGLLLSLCNLATLQKSGHCDMTAFSISFHCEDYCWQTGAQGVSEKPEELYSLSKAKTQVLSQPMCLTVPGQAEI